MSAVLRDAPIRVLTVHRPWAWAFTHAGKRVENRTWPAPLWLLDGWLAIHAGAHFDEEAAKKIREWQGQLIEPMVHAPLCPREPEHARGIVGFGRLRRTGAPGASPSVYAVGPNLWHVPEFHVLEQPIPARGRQGLWEPPPEALEAFEAHLAGLP